MQEGQNLTFVLTLFYSDALPGGCGWQVPSMPAAMVSGASDRQMTTTNLQQPGGGALALPNYTVPQQQPPQKNSAQFL